MKKDEAFEILNEAEGMSKEEIVEKFKGVEAVRFACGMVRDMSKVSPEVAKQAFNIYKVIRSKSGGLSILKKLAEKAGIKYDEPPNDAVAEKKEKAPAEKKEKKAAPAPEKKAATVKKETPAKKEAKKPVKEVKEEPPKKAKIPAKKK
jgi:outer membrane biosynthesis protein TonB